MFGQRTKGNEAESNQDNATRDSRSEVVTASPARTVTEASSSQRIASPVIAPRRVSAIAFPETGRRSSSGEGDVRTLRVGKGLVLAGEITSCDILVVEGKVEAKLSDGKMLEITEAGQFRGSVEIENADIAGRYDGQLVVHGRLTVRSTGRVSGMVKYGELEVNAGGQIIGEIQVVGGAAQASGGNNFKSAAKFAGMGDELEQDERRERKSA